MQSIILVNLNIALVVLNIIQYFNCATARYLETEVNKSQTIFKENKNMTTIRNLTYNITSGTTTVREYCETTAKLRTKRESPGGKYVDAAKMGQSKVLVLWLQMFANMWRTTYVGGSHPLHKDVPKPLAIMLKRRIGEFLFPKMEQQEKTKMR